MCNTENLWLKSTIDSKLHEGRSHWMVTRSVALQVCGYCVVSSDAALIDERCVPAQVNCHCVDLYVDAVHDASSVNLTFSFA